MAKTKYYLDARSVAAGKPATVKIALAHHGKTVYIPSNVSVLPENWNGSEVVGRRDAASANSFLLARKSQVDTFLYQLVVSGESESMTAAEIRDLFYMKVDRKQSQKAVTFVARYEDFMERKRGKTRLVYKHTLQLIHAYDPKADTRRFESIDRTWIESFDNWMGDKEYSQSTRSMALRNIRAVFNDAIDCDVTTCYPFRKIHIKVAQTKDRSMSVDELRTLFSYPCAEWQQEYVDMFKLIFLLRGINIGDLALLDRRMPAGRIEYFRQKTEKHFSIKVEPEALEIIEKYRGKTHLLSILDRYKKYEDYAHHMNDGLKTIGLNYRNGAKYTGTPLFPELSTYYARYSWATIAAELDIPRETIAAGLGHSQHDVTAIYIRNDMTKKVDEANRKVIDYVFGSDPKEKPSESHDWEGN